MAWHLEAVGSQGQRGTGDPKTMDLASLLYKKVADTWNAEEFSKFEFPRLVKEDWPTIYKIKYNMADLLYFRERWAECGPAFDAVVQEDPKARGRGQRRVRRGALLPEHLPGRRTRRAPTRRAAATSRASATTSSATTTTSTARRT